MELTKELLEKAADQNVLIYDRDDKRHDLTYRLVDVMLQFGQKEYNTLFHSIYIGKDAWVEDFKYYSEIHGLKIIRDGRFNIDGELTKYYQEELKATLEVNDEHICLAVSDDACVLGSF